GVLAGFTTGAINGLIYNSLLNDDGDLNVNLMRGTFEGFKEGIMGAIVGAGAGALGGGILYAGSFLIKKSNIRGVVAECLAAAQQLKCPLTKKPLIRFDLSKFVNNKQLKGDVGEAADRWIHSDLDFIGTGKYNSINGGDNIFSSTGSNNLLLSECKYIDGWNSARKTINWLMNKNKAYGGYPQMSDGWVKGVIEALINRGNDMGNKLKSAFDGGTLDRSITIVNEWGESFLYKLVNGSWTLQ
ncbi:MAG: hypothetical protein LBU34_16910, partial [Planctomycetaceae bacterium]|nr:hypothetical protein [Planctomycetaceae bacterium]